MCSIYVINVGANTNHSSKARSPIFNDGSFVFVSFFADQNETHRTCYPEKMLPFTDKHKQNLKTHNDPDWENMTYGDICSGRGSARGSKLRCVKRGDILLFWGLLYCNECSDWKNCVGQKGACWDAFSRPLDKNKGWYLLGALRVKKIVVGKNTLDGLSPDEVNRIKKNAHFVSNEVPTHHRIFLGDKEKKHSRLFEKAVELWVPKSNTQNGWKSSLMYKTFRAANGQYFSLNVSPHWYSSLRPCRKMWDLNKTKEHQLAKHVRDAIRCKNPHFDLLKDI